MPKDEKALRPPTARAKLNQIRGVSGEEKALLQRVGNLIDVLTFAQRQNQNPRSTRRQISDEIPGPKNVRVTPSTGGVQIEWDAVNMNELDFYEVQVSETTTFAEFIPFQVVDTGFSYRATPSTGALFIRVRSVSKRGEVSLWSPTVEGNVFGNTIFQADQDHIEPENRTTVLPKPTLVGDIFAIGPGHKAFVGIGAYVGPSPLTFSDDHEGHTSDLLKRHEISYSLFDVATPHPPIDQRFAPTIGEYIDRDGFYTYSPSFYMHMSCMPGSVSDFFPEVDLESDDDIVQLNVEFLRYVPQGGFYDPRYAQTGYVFNATMSNIKF